ncbi:MAG: hypothetical protein ACFFD4_24200 [Candidatus Odinarchaeota archaeon]
MATAWFYSWSMAKTRRRLLLLFRKHNAFSAEQTITLKSEQELKKLAFESGCLSKIVVGTSLRQFFSYALSRKWMIRLPYQDGEPFTDGYSTSSNDIFPGRFYYNKAKMVKNGRIWLSLTILSLLVSVMLFLTFIPLPIELSISERVSYGGLFSVITFFSYLEMRISGELKWSFRN